MTVFADPPRVCKACCKSQIKEGSRVRARASGAVGTVKYKAIHDWVGVLFDGAPCIVERPIEQLEKF